MKRVGELIALNISVLGLPGIINLVSSKFYLENASSIWLITGVLAFISSITQFQFSQSPKISILFRRLRFHLFKTKNIAGLLFSELLVVVGLLIFRAQMDNFRVILISLTINLIGINLLIITEKLTNSDSTELIFHTPKDGCVYLYSKNRIRYVPDPETFNLLGLSWSNVVDLSEREFITYEKLPPITSAKEMKLFNYKNSIYGLVNDKLKHIPNEATLNYIQRIGNHSPITPLNDLNGFAIDKPFESFQIFF
ncbi:MAG TPA: hypothetical protein VHB54_09505 [Mucilaginibacter sp.]|nr:hypothetical protein [Mucilaginibacter sp.]